MNWVYDYNHFTALAFEQQPHQYFLYFLFDESPLDAPHPFPSFYSKYDKDVH